MLQPMVAKGPANYVKMCLGSAHGSVQSWMYPNGDAHDQQPRQPKVEERTPKTQKRV